jgi:hypothetical protein
MQIHFKTSLCRKCPHDVFVVCAYKKAIREALSGILTGMHFSHKCSLYHHLFKPGQVVTLDLYNHLRDPSGIWRWELAHKNVSGVVVGTHFEFYVVELHKMVLLSRRCDKDPDVEIIKPYFTYKKPAKGLQLLPDVVEIVQDMTAYACGKTELCWN